MSARGDFFAIDRRTWERVCRAGMNPACAYLVLACFSARDNRRTNASVQAVEKYTSISRSRSRLALEAILGKGYVQQTRRGLHPRYDLLPAAELPGVISTPPRPVRLRREAAVAFAERLTKWEAQERAAKKPDLIWLPNDLVTGAAGETPPIARVRQTQDAMTLRLLVDLYYAQDLREDGGVSRRVTYQKFKRVRVGQSGPFIVWGFEREGAWVDWQLPIAACHRREALTPAEKKDKANPGVDFFRRQDELLSLGLVEWVPTLFEGEDLDAEMLHPYGTMGTDGLTDRLGAAAHQAGLALLTENQTAWVNENALLLAPIHRHVGSVAMIGVARLRYRPRTSKTAAWLADLTDKGERLVARYGEIADRRLHQAVTSSEPLAASMVLQ